MDQSRSLVSIVIPLYNEQADFPLLKTRLVQLEQLLRHQQLYLGSNRAF